MRYDYYLSTADDIACKHLIAAMLVDQLQQGYQQAA